jgi:hypothetical protein
MTFTTRQWRISHNKELHNMRTLPNIVRVLSWRGQVAYIREIIYSFLGNLIGKCLLQDQDTDGKY